jgi:hypothetical protein
MRNTRTIVTIFLISFAPLQAFGSPPGQEIKAEKRGLIKELFDVTRAGLLSQNATDAMLNQLEKNMPQLAAQVIDSAPALKPKRRAELQKVMDETRTRMLRRMRDLMHEKMNLAEITEQMFYPLYDKYFNEDELRGLISFYKSPVGQKSLDVLPALFQEALARSSELMEPKLMPIIMQVLDEEKQRLAKAKKP